MDIEFLATEQTRSSPSRVNRQQDYKRLPPNASADDS
jgi:hypothetical protein